LSRCFLWPVRVYYEDTDAGSVVYHANYLNFMERARTEYLRSLGHEQDLLVAEEGVIFAVRSLTIDYIKPARFNQLLQVSAEILKLKKASLEFSQKITHDSQLLATASVRIACVDAVSLKPRAIPEYLLAQFTDEY
jgi:acyl-CoA thioester hydrolase